MSSRRFLIAALAVSTLFACGKPAEQPAHDGHQAAGGYRGDGLSETYAGLRLEKVDADSPNEFAFRILGPDGQAETEFTPEQTKRMHFYVVRDDVTGYQHVHPTMSPDGVWTAGITPLSPGNYRVYTQFTAGGSDGMPVTPVLSTSVTVPGVAGARTPLPPVSDTAIADGYSVKLSERNLHPGMDMPITMTVTKDGRPVTDLQPYLETSAHVTAIHEGDLAFAHLHPEGEATTGPELELTANLPKPGKWRLFIQFQTDGTLHTAPVTVDTVS